MRKKILNPKRGGWRGAFLLLAVLTFLAGCNGGSGDVNSWTGSSGSAGSGGAASSGTAATSIQLLVSTPQMMSWGSTPVDLTAVVLNDKGQVLAGRNVTLSQEGDSSAYFSNISNGSISDSNGLVTAKLNLGTNKANRLIAIRASADTTTVTNTVEVIGTTVSVSGSSSIAFGDSTQLTVSVKDSAGVAIANVAVTATSQNGNTVVFNRSTTDSSGGMVATVTATHTGNDVITIAAGGASKSQALTISSATFGFLPLATTEIQLNSPTVISTRWLNAGSAVDGAPVTFSTSRGTIVGSPAVTDANGVAAVTISGASSGPATITAFGSGGTPSATTTVLFVSTTSVNSITIQAIPQTVKPTTTAAGQIDNNSTISVIVRDLANNLVKDARVTFSIVADSTGGGLTASTAVTDAAGTASVNYLAGSSSSAQNGVVIRATVNDVNGIPIPATPVIYSQTSLTVGGAALFVRLGTDNKVAVVGPNLLKTYSALVTDSAGNPVPAGTEVRFVLRPNRYKKGFYWTNDTVSSWQQTINANCPNEDLNFNGIVESSVAPTLDYAMGGTLTAPGPIVVAPDLAVSPYMGLISQEDYNSNGKLDPGNVASVNPSATTDGNGFAMATIAYAKSYANWTELTLEGRAGTVGNDPPNSVNFVLPGLAADYSNVLVSPPGETSPFGLGAGHSCLVVD